MHSANETRRRGHARWIAAGVLGAACAVSVAMTQISPEDAGYAVGFDLGTDAASRLGADGVNYNADLLIAGFTDAVMGKDGQLDAATRRQVLANLEREVATRLAEARIAGDHVFAAEAEANLARSEAFHASYGAKDGVRTLPSGVQYRVVTEGKGPVPSGDSSVVISFEARLLGGEVFAIEQEQEAKLEYMFEGARDAIMRMPAGSVWEIAIPPSQAFGLGGQPPLVGPNETVFATVQLHEVK
ncbi:MAG: FKBP-type peptidyl-prolyl cis-trans isomerase N-terminal domain-containing protein [Planctomycetota bacterium]